MSLSRRSGLRLGAGAFVLLLVALAGSQFAAAQDMPITTKSKDALTLFLDGRAKDENYHVEEAHKIFAQAAAKDPDFALAHLWVAMTAADPKVLREELKKAVSLAPNASKGEQLLIAAWGAANLENDPVKANDLLGQLVALFPNDKRAHLYLANNYNAREQTDKAIAEFDKAIALDKDFGRAHYQLAYVYYPKGDFDKAEEHFKVYLRLAPQEPNPHDCLADLYMKMGRFDEAISEYQQAVKLDPRFSASQLKTGSTYVLMGRYEEGRQAFEKSITMEIEPAYKIGDQEAIARSYVFAGEYSNAIEPQDKAIRMARELGIPEAEAWGHLIKAMIYSEMKDPEKAAQSLADSRTCINDSSLSPSDKELNLVTACFFEALVAADQKDTAKAKAKLSELKAGLSKVKDPLFPRYAEWMDGYIALAQGDFAGADAQFSKVVIEDPYFIYYAAVAKEKAGDTAGAKKLYAKVANWNVDSVWYSFVRNKAKAKV